MAKEAKSKEDIDKLFKIYFSCISGRYFSEALKAFEKLDGYGHEYVCCSLASTYQPWEEGYFGDTGVKISIEYPAVPTDTTAIIANEEFYNYLKQACKAYVTNYPEKQHEVESKLVVIRSRLNIS